MFDAVASARQEQGLDADARYSQEGFLSYAFHSELQLAFGPVDGEDAGAGHRIAGDGEVERELRGGRGDVEGEAIGGGVVPAGWLRPSARLRAR